MDGITRMVATEIDIIVRDKVIAILENLEEQFVVKADTYAAGGSVSESLYNVAECFRATIESMTPEEVDYSADIDSTELVNDDAS